MKYIRCVLLSLKAFAAAVFTAGEIQRQKEFEVAMFMYRTGEQQQKAYNNDKNETENGKHSGRLKFSEV